MWLEEKLLTTTPLVGELIIAVDGDPFRRLDPVMRTPSIQAIEATLAHTIPGHCN